MTSKSYNSINGILLLDKPLHASSNQVLQKVKHLYKVKKAGHTGCLDPLATGMLPICLNEATKFSQFLLDNEKHYFVVAELGTQTDTGDAEGQVIATQTVPPISEEYLRSVLLKFEGEIQQIPPMYSALKHQGTPLYKFARQGIDIERKPRDVSIYQIQFKHFNNRQLALEVHCSKGTYIRTLIEDIGKHLKCGAHVIELRRLKVGHLEQSGLITLTELQALTANELQAQVKPISVMLAPLPKIMLADPLDERFWLGQKLPYADLPSGQWVRVYSERYGFIGVGQGESEGQLLVPVRLMQKNC